MRCCTTLLRFCRRGLCCVYRVLSRRASRRDFSCLEHGLLYFMCREARCVVLRFRGAAVGLKCPAELLSFCAIAGTLLFFMCCEARYIYCAAKHAIFIVLRSTLYYFNVPVRARVLIDNLPLGDQRVIISVSGGSV